MTDSQGQSKIPDIKTCTLKSRELHDAETKTEPNKGQLNNSTGSPVHTYIMISAKINDVA